MKENNPISRETQTRDAVLITLSGGIIAVISSMAELDIFSNVSQHADAAVKLGGVDVVSLSLVFMGGRKIISSIRSSELKDKK